MAKPVAPATITDAEICGRILGEIDKQPWGPRASVTVEVKDGVAKLFGTITDERERAASQVLAEDTAGVKAVRDHLVWVEPLSGFVIPADNPEQPLSSAFGFAAVKYKSSDLRTQNWPFLPSGAIR
jgi:hypothetical protein